MTNDPPPTIKAFTQEDIDNGRFETYFQQSCGSGADELLWQEKHEADIVTAQYEAHHGKGSAQEKQKEQKKQTRQMKQKTQDAEDIMGKKADECLGLAQFFALMISIGIAILSGDVITGFFLGIVSMLVCSSVIYLILALCSPYPLNKFFYARRTSFGSGSHQSRPFVSAFNNWSTDPANPYRW